MFAIDFSTIPSSFPSLGRGRDGNKDCRFSLTYFSYNGYCNLLESLLVRTLTVETLSSCDSDRTSASAWL